jgi:D-lactate dehydrogenase (cytochrome)
MTNALRFEPNPEFFAAMEELFGPRFSQAEAVRRQHAGMETHERALAPDGVVMAADIDHVKAVVTACRHFGSPLIAHGAGTSLEGHLSAVRGGVSLDLTQMNRILEINPENLHCRVEAGVTREQLNRHLRDQGLFFPIDPGANATLGGMAATGASGTNAVRYGVMRDNVMSLQVVLESGIVVETGTRAAKSSAGYDLTSLFVGSEGTLGVITALTLRLHPIPEIIMAGTCCFTDLDGAVRVVIAAIQGGLPMARIELLDSAQVAACNAYSRLGLPAAPTLFLEFHGSRAGVEEQVGQFRSLAESYGGRAIRFVDRIEDRSALWKARHDAYFAAKALRTQSWVWSTDVCVPIAELANSIAAVRADLDAQAMTATIVGHVGDGNYHVLFVLDPNNSDEMDRAASINADMVSRAIAVGGTCTGEHGVGMGKRRSLLEERGPAAVGIMRALKAALDPSGMFNPEKIFEQGP